MPDKKCNWCGLSIRKGEVEDHFDTNHPYLEVEVVDRDV